MMKKLTWFGMLCLVVSSLLLAACAAPAATAVKKEIPAPYAGMKNPFNGQADAIEEGKEIYTDNCATCHGDSGKGDGPGGASLKIKPADLWEPAANDGDDFLVWIVSEGGAAVGKSEDMPVWKESLSQDEIWKVLAFVRTFK